jgi:hypothetical protein
MPDNEALRRALKDRREGKSPSTQAGEFVREEFEHIREGKHGARSAKQAIAIGLSEARRAGIPLKPPAKGRVSDKTRKSAISANKKGQKGTPISKTRSAASEKALKREPKRAASRLAISRQAHAAAKSRSPAERSRAAKKAVATKGPVRRSQAAKKAAATRSRRAASRA